MTFSPLQLPTIRFGRRIDRQSGSDFYAVLEQSEAFPAEAENLFRETICKSVQWESGRAEQRYENAFLFWKVNAAQTLASQISDAGNDLRGRPHSLQIIAVLAETKTLAEILADIQSPAEIDAALFADLPHSLKNHHHETEIYHDLNETIQKFFADSHSENLLVADISSIISRNVGQRFDLKKKTADFPEKNQIYQNRTIYNEMNTENFSQRKRKQTVFFVILPIVLIILTIFLSGLLVRQYSQLYQSRYDLRQMTKSHEELLKTNQSLEQEMQELRRQTSRQDDELTELRSQQKNWKQEKTSLEDRNRRLENERKADRLTFEQQLIDARKNAQQSLIDENDRLRKESVQNRAILDEIELVIKKREK